jgi:hypothetical protein
MDAELVFRILNVVQAGLNFAAARGVSRKDALALLEQAHVEDRDVTTAEVQAQLDVTQAGLDETRRLLEGDQP